LCAHKLKLVPQVDSRTPATLLRYHWGIRGRFALAGAFMDGRIVRRVRNP
jgi:hypothetical protein